MHNKGHDQNVQLPTLPSQFYLFIFFQCSARAARSYEQKRRLCDFDSQVVNLIECLQKRKKITV